MPGIVEDLRQIKDADEVVQIRLAIRQAEKGFDVLRAQDPLKQAEGSPPLQEAITR